MTYVLMTYDGDVERHERFAIGLQKSMSSTFPIIWDFDKKELNLSIIFFKTKFRFSILFYQIEKCNAKDVAAKESVFKIYSCGLGSLECTLK